MEVPIYWIIALASSLLYSAKATCDSCTSSNLRISKEAARLEIIKREMDMIRLSFPDHTCKTWVHISRILKSVSKETHSEPTILVFVTPESSAVTDTDKATGGIVGNNENYVLRRTIKNLEDKEVDQVNCEVMESVLTAIQRKVRTLNNKVFVLTLVTPNNFTSVRTSEQAGVVFAKNKWCVPQARNIIGAFIIRIYLVLPEHSSNSFCPRSYVSRRKPSWKKPPDLSAYEVAIASRRRKRHLQTLKDISRSRSDVNRRQRLFWRSDTSISRSTTNNKVRNVAYSSQERGVDFKSSGKGNKNYKFNRRDENMAPNDHSINNKSRKRKKNTFSVDTLFRQFGPKSTVTFVASEEEHSTTPDFPPVYTYYTTQMPYGVGSMKNNCSEVRYPQQAPYSYAQTYNNPETQTLYPTTSAGMQYYYVQGQNISSNDNVKFDNTAQHVSRLEANPEQVSTVQGQNYIQGSEYEDEHQPVMWSTTGNAEDTILEKLSQNELTLLSSLFTFANRKSQAPTATISTSFVSGTEEALRAGDLVSKRPSHTEQEQSDTVQGLPNENPKYLGQSDKKSVLLSNGEQGARVSKTKLSEQSEAFKQEMDRLQNLFPSQASESWDLVKDAILPVVNNNSGIASILLLITPEGTLSTSQCLAHEIVDTITDLVGTNRNGRPLRESPSHEQKQVNSVHQEVKKNAQSPRKTIVENVQEVNCKLLEKVMRNMMENTDSLRNTLILLSVTVPKSIFVNKKNTQNIALEDISRSSCSEIDPRIRENVIDNVPIFPILVIPESSIQHSCSSFDSDVRHQAKCPCSKCPSHSRKKRSRKKKGERDVCPSQRPFFSEWENLGIAPPERRDIEKASYKVDARHDPELKAAVDLKLASLSKKRTGQHVQQDLTRHEHTAYHAYGHGGSSQEIEYTTGSSLARNSEQSSARSINLDNKMQKAAEKAKERNGQLESHPRQGMKVLTEPPLIKSYPAEYNHESPGVRRVDDLLHLKGAPLTSHYVTEVNPIKKVRPKQEELELTRQELHKRDHEQQDQSASDSRPEADVVLHRSPARNYVFTGGKINSGMMNDDPGDESATVSNFKYRRMESRNNFAKTAKFVIPNGDPDRSHKYRHSRRRHKNHHNVR